MSGLPVKKVTFDAVERGDVRLKEKGVAELVFKFRPTAAGRAALFELCNIEGPIDLTCEGRQGDIEEVERREKAAAEADKEQMTLGALPPEPGTLDHGLHQALHESPAACDKWNALRDTGANDELLLASIEQEFNLGELEHRKSGGKPYMVRDDGEASAFWWERSNRRGKPTLEGADLLAAVRKLLTINLRPEDLYSPEELAAAQEREPGEEDVVDAEPESQPEAAGF